MSEKEREFPTTIRAGCQTITWGEGQREFLPAVFSEAASAGYAGVEVGFRHLRNNAPEHLSTLLDNNGLLLFASHIVGNLEDYAQADAESPFRDKRLKDVEFAGGVMRLKKDPDTFISLGTIVRNTGRERLEEKYLMLPQMLKQRKFRRMVHSAVFAHASPKIDR